MTATPSKKTSSSSNTIATNRKARRDYHILDKMEAGIELKGTEVKSIRARDVSIAESFASIENGEVILQNLHVKPYKYAPAEGQNPIRPRRLLLHRREIEKLVGQTAEKGLTLVPLSIYLKRGRIKVELALCSGKHAADKRDTLKKKTADREAKRAIAEHKRR
jgi:SsrA-binding protein